MTLPNIFAIFTFFLIVAFFIEPTKTTREVVAYLRACTEFHKIKWLLIYEDRLDRERLFPAS